MYQNPYGSDQQETDPAAVRRKAILDLMDPQPTRTPMNTGGGPGELLDPRSRPAPFWQGTDLSDVGGPTLPAPGGMHTMGQPSTSYTPAAASTYPGAQTASSPSPRDTASGSDTPDAPDANPPAGSPGATLPPSTPASGDDGRHYGAQILDLYDDPYKRRDTYGGSDPKRKAIAGALVSSGNPYLMAAGAVGYLDAWLHRKADSAPTDFNLNDAQQIVRDAYKDMFGREAKPGEVESALAGQGLKSGDRFVGEAGIQGVLGHLAQNAAAERAAGGGTAAAGTTSAPPTAGAGTTGTTGSGATAAGTAAASTAAGGGNMGYLEGFEKDKFDDPNKHDTKYDFAHLVGGLPPTPATLDAQWDAIVKQFPNAKRTGTGSIDFGDGGGSIDVIRAAGEGGKAWHFEPESGATSATTTAAPASAGIGGLPTSPAATAGLAAPLTNNTVLQQIMEEVQRIQRGEAPRNAILSQMGLA